MKKCLKITILLIIMLIIGGLSAYAAENTVSFVASSEEVKVGDTITVTFSATSDESIGGLDGLMEYDPEKLEFLNEKEIEESSISMRVNDEIPGAFQLSFLTSGTSVTKTLKFKVLDNVEEDEELYIELTNIRMVVGEDDEEIDMGEKEIKLTVIKSAEDPTEDPTEDPAEDPTDGAEDEPEEKPTEKPATKSSDKEDDGTTAKKSINYAGLKNYTVVAIAVFSIISVIAYLKYRQYKNI